MWVTEIKASNRDQGCLGRSRLVDIISMQPTEVNEARWNSMMVAVVKAVQKEQGKPSLWLSADHHANSYIFLAV